VNLHEFDQRGVRTIAGDASDPSILMLAAIDRAITVVICVPDDVDAGNIVQQIRAANSDK
jgi:voltage-gated potassium channel Kch